LPLPKDVPATVRVVAVAEMGHRAEMKLSVKKETSSGESPSRADEASVIPEVSAEEVTASLSKKEIEALVERTVQRELAPIKSLLAEILKELQEPSFSEIIGGIGYIFGLFGIIAWAYSRKK